MDVKGNTRICSSPLDRTEEKTHPPAPLPMYLIMVRGGITGALLRVEARTTSLGRSIDNTHSFQDATVSRRHAALSHDAEGRAWLADLGSSNGTFVNGKRLVPHRPTRLEPGGRIQLGASVVLKYVGLDPCEERFQRELFDRAVRDNLTGLYNRAYFLEQVEARCDHALLRGMSMALLMVDVDHFKRINDDHGHDAGDAALREVAKVLRDSTRTDDLVARYGGEEFLVALPVLDEARAIERAERIRLHLAQRPIRAAGGTLRLTVSIGLSHADWDQPRNIARLITLADAALYAAKRGGRNRVISASGLLPECQPGTESVDAMAIFRPASETPLPTPSLASASGS